MDDIAIETSLVSESCCSLKELLRGGLYAVCPIATPLNIDMLSEISTACDR